jgi:hypothetical protein
MMVKESFANLPSKQEVQTDLEWSEVKGILD